MHDATNDDLKKVAWKGMSSALFAQDAHTSTSHSQIDKKWIMSLISRQHPLCVAVMPNKKIHAFCGQCLQRHFRELGNMSNRPQLQTTCNHTSPGPPHPASSSVGSPETSHTNSWWNWGVFLSVIKPLCGEKTNSDWLGPTPQCPPRLLPSHSLEPTECISIDRFPYMNSNSVKSLKLLHVVYIFVQYSFKTYLRLAN